MKPTDLDRILDKKLSDITVREAFLAVRVFLRLCEQEEDEDRETMEMESDQIRQEADDIYRNLRRK